MRKIAYFKMLRMGGGSFISMSLPNIEASTTNHLLMELESFIQMGKISIHLLPFHLQWFAYYDNLPTATSPSRLG